MIALAALSTSCHGYWYHLKVQPVIMILGVLPPVTFVPVTGVVLQEYHDVLVTRLTFNWVSQVPHGTMVPVIPNYMLKSVTSNQLGM